MYTENLLDKEVSFQPTVWKGIFKEMTIRDVLNEIKSVKYKNQIELLRKFITNNQLEEYSIHKKNLPAVTFCGTFEGKRRKEFLKKYNFLMVLDIDKLISIEFERVKQILLEDKFVFASWESPSQKGIKGLVSLTYDFIIDNSNIDYCHKSAFRKLEEYFQHTYSIELDESGSDTTRLCFLSSDLNLNCKTNYIPFVIDKVDVEIEKVNPKTKHNKLHIQKSITKKKILFNPENKNNPYLRKEIQAIIKYLTKRSLSITYNYEEWYRVAYAIANTFTYEIGEKYFLSLSKIDKNKFNETDCKNMLIYCYENLHKNEISFRTINYLAINQGYKTSNQREAVPKVDNES